MLDLRAEWSRHWDEQVAERRKHSPSYEVGDYTATGRAAAQYGGKRNADYWADNGIEHAKRYAAWRRATQWEIWETPEGESGIELQLNVVLPGDIPVKMFLDRVFVLPSGELGVVDLKSGRVPENEEQLGLYATGLELTFGAAYRPMWGYFFSTEKGENIGPFDLSRWTPEFFSRLYGMAIRGINAGSFAPKPANNCKNWCGAADYCAAVNGPKAAGVDPLLPL